MSAVFDAGTKVIDLGQPEAYDTLRELAEADVHSLLQDADPEVLDEIEGNQSLFTAIRMDHFDQMSLAIPREKFAELRQAKRERDILKALYRRFFEAAVISMVSCHQQDRAARSRQHKQRLQK